MSKIDTILDLLAARVSNRVPSGCFVERNPLDIETVPVAGFVAIRDGNPGEPDVLLSPLTYIYDHVAELEVVVEGEDEIERGPRFRAVTAAISAAILEDRTFGGLAEWSEPQAPAPVGLPAEGGEAMKAAIVPVLIRYDTPDPLA